MVTTQRADRSVRDLQYMNRRNTPPEFRSKTSTGSHPLSWPEAFICELRWYHGSARPYIWMNRLFFIMESKEGLR